ncbi:MAG: ribonuclease H-like domain-containing protein [Candidatus Spechtbacterales bacterium]|nr:ribonuclease H-like domain-containing protein [Candidatus Spechtbacterales bacterium]
MSYLVIDIETIGEPYENFDEKSKEKFREWAERDSDTEEDIEEQLEAVKERLVFSPFTGEIVSIAVLDDQDKGAVYFQAPDSDLKDWEEDGVQYRVGTEKEILERFWEVANHYDVFVTFNGRGFDAPYLMIRAAVHGVQPTKQLMGYRYQNGRGSGTQHVDLADQLSFYGAMRRTSLHFTTRAFGIKSPKKGDVEGKEVPQAFKDKRYKEIAEYNFADVVATRELFQKWNKYININ